MNSKTLVLEELADEVFETDLLIVGGGLAGSTAAIKAKEKKDIDVLILEKAAIRRSGECGAGMDHYPAVAHPKINDITPEHYGKTRSDDFQGLANSRLSIITAKDILKPIALLEDIGVKVREEDGHYRLLSARNPKGDFILYRGADLKLKLAAAVRKKGVRVLNRTMCTKIITKNGSVLGATAVNVRNGKFIVIKAKTILLCTGGIQRLYGYPFATFPNNLFMAYTIATNAGDGASLAYRAGARLVNMEFTYVHVGLAGWPQAAHVRHAVPILNSKGENIQKKYAIEVEKKYGGGGFYPWTNFTYMPDMPNAEALMDVLYHDATNSPDETETYGYFMAANETPMSVKILRDRGGLKAGPFEMRDWIAGLFRSFSGVLFDEKGETNIKGLFVAGDTQGGIPGYGASGAQVWGYRIGSHVSQLAPSLEMPQLGKEQLIQIKSDRDRVFLSYGRKGGVNPLELEDYVRKVMQNYVQINKVGPKLERAVELIRLVRERFVPEISAGNPHELMRALEVQIIIDVAEMHSYSALLRTESRMPPYHYRLDFPEQDDEKWLKSIVVQNLDGELQHSYETMV